MSNEKITKEELLNKLGGEALNDEELDKVSGGAGFCMPMFVWDPKIQDCRPKTPEELMK